MFCLRAREVQLAADLRVAGLTINRWFMKHGLHFLQLYLGFPPFSSSLTLNFSFLLRLPFFLSLPISLFISKFFLSFSVPPSLSYSHSLSSILLSSSSFFLNHSFPFSLFLPFLSTSFSLYYNIVYLYLPPLTPPSHLPLLITIGFMKFLLLWT